jgi:hypothetical protein
MIVVGSSPSSRYRERGLVPERVRQVGRGVVPRETKGVHRGLHVPLEDR